MVLRTGRLAATLTAFALVSACGADERRPNLLLVSIDTCRADHLSAYGYERETSPQLDHLAEVGVLFEAAFCQVPDTTPSHASLLTGTYPDFHGSANGVPLGAGPATLAEILGDAGYRTGAFVSGSTMTASLSGLQRGFDVYNDRMTVVGSAGASKPNERLAKQTTNRALNWLSQDSEAEAFFLFVHYFDPHGIYAPPAPYDTMFESAGRTPLAPEDIPNYARIEGELDLETYVDRYDGEIRYVDDQLQRIFARLDVLDEFERTVIAVTSDHGEDLGEHGLYFSHGWRLYDPALRIPMIVSGPGLPRGVRVPDPVQTVDLTATLLEVLALPIPPAMQGESLTPLIEDPGSAMDRRIFARTTKTRTYLKLSRKEDVRDFRALRDSDWKYLESVDGEVRALFGLKAAAGESESVLGANGELGARYGAHLRALLEAVQEGRSPSDLGEEDPAASEALLEELRALGYVR